MQNMAHYIGKKISFISIEQSSRIYVAKALGIICVVVGHSGSPFADFIYLFHMPLFFFISGYLYQDHYTLKPVLLIKKRIKSLYIPFVKYGIIFLIFHNIFARLHLYSDFQLYTWKQYLREFANIVTFGGTETFLGIFWFITSLFWVNILYCLLSHFIYRICEPKKDRILFITIVSIFLVGNVLSIYKLFLPRVFDITFVALMFFYIGSSFRKHEYKIIYNPIICFSCFLFLITSTLYGSISMVGRSYVSPAFILSNAMAGVYLTLYVSNIFKNSKCLNFVGENTLPILAFHFVSFKIVNVVQVYLYSYPNSMIGEHPIIHENCKVWWIAYVTVGLFIPLLIASIGSKLSLYIKSVV